MNTSRCDHVTVGNENKLNGINLYRNTYGFYAQEQQQRQQKNREKKTFKMKWQSCIT